MTSLRPSEPLLTALVVGAGVVLCVFAYWPALSGGLVFDDYPLLVDQNCWRGLSRVPAMLGVGGDAEGCGYRPIRYVSFAIDYSIAGFNVTFFHLSNLVYHLLAFVAVFALFQRLTGSRAAAVGALIWALHPVNSDAVAYISGRRDVLTGLFFVLALIPLIPSKGKQLDLRGLTLSVVFFWLAFQAKEMAVTLPVVAGWYMVTQKRELVLKTVRQFWWVYLVLGGMAAGFTLYRGYLAPATHLDGWWGDSIGSNFATVFALLPRYFELVLWPSRLIGDYHPHTIPIATSFGDPRTILGVTLTALLVGATLFSLWKKQRLVGFGCGWFLITMLPVSHIIPHHELFAEHYLYIPLIGLVLASLPLLQWAFERRRGTSRLLVWTVLAASLLAFAGRTHVRGYDYRSEISFNLAALPHAPMNMRVLYTLGVSYREADKCELAIPLLDRALQLVPDQSIMGHESLVAYVQCAEHLGGPDYRSHVYRLVSSYPSDPVGLAWMGRLNFDDGNNDLAIEYLERSRALGSETVPTLLEYLAGAYNRAGRHQDAIDALSELESTTPRSCEQESLALVGLGATGYERAFLRIESCLEEFPESFVLIELHVRLLVALGRVDLARADVEVLRELGAPESLVSSLEALLP